MAIVWVEAPTKNFTKMEKSLFLFLENNLKQLFCMITSRGKYYAKQGIILELLESGIMI